MSNLVKTFMVLAALLACLLPASAQPEITWDSRSLMVDGRRVVPVMGEIHYSRLPENEWEAELKKMKDGGVTMVATYVFWNHIEELEGQYDWSGRRSLRRFLELCRQEGLPVVLRVGPFCHGEARCGGMPDWLFAKGVKVRSEDAAFLGIVEGWYRQVFTQVQGLQWKDGGPVVACQFDNEWGGRGSYLMALKRLANGIGFDLPFYTRTGWPEMKTPTPFGAMLPLYGDYADGFWDRSLKETAGNYYKAFFFKPARDSKSIGSEQLDYSQKGKDSSRSALRPSPQTYPYFTCELGGGMVPAYHRRPYMYPNDSYAMAVVKLGSGSNLLGYYVYHGGTNPDGRLTSLNECQKTVSTNYNDLPVKTYDYQAPLGEFGLRNPVYYRLRPLHLFMHDFQETLAPMDAHFVNSQEIKKGDDSYLRWSYRCPPVPEGEATGAGPAFVFFNNYERLQKLTAKKNVRFDVGGVRFPSKPVTIPADAIGILPVNVAGIKYATAQLVASRDGKVYLMQIKGLPVEIAFEGGKTLRNAKPRGTQKPVYKNYYLLTEDEAGHLFLPEEKPMAAQPVPYRKVREAGPPRVITIGVAKVAEAPVDKDFDAAAVYAIDLPADSSAVLDIDYHGDCARLYADGRLVDDNFYNGRHFQYGLWRLPKGTARLELRILPMQKDEPVYFPREADTTPGESVRSVTCLK